MGSNVWFFQAVGAAIVWGLGYALTEKIIRETNVGPAFLIVAIEAVTLPFFILIAWKCGELTHGIAALQANPKIITVFLISAMCAISGNYLIFSSIAGKNATLASLIEISYPFFTAFFAYVIFKESHLSYEIAIGALLVFTGIAIIFANS